MDIALLFLLILAAMAAGAGVARATAARHGSPVPPHPAPPDPQLAHLGAELRRLQDLVREAERERAESFGMLHAQIRAAGEQTARLADTTGELREALSSAKARGQWGERMAEDVLRLAGFAEGVNYVKQRAIAAGVPDFTFLLPGGLRLHMDVKFPLDNYLRYLRAEQEADGEAARAQFLRDVRVCVRGLADRSYADPSETVDCVLLFIPNEQLFGFIQAQDPAILDEALGRKVVLCSPMTLFAVLAVIRQAVDSFRLERTSDEILVLLSKFGAQWDRYTGELDRLGRQLETARRTYDELTGPRRRQLERPLDKLDELRRSRGLEGPEDAAAYSGPDAPSPSLSLAE